VEVNRLRQRAVEMKLKNVIFLPSVPMAEVGTVLNAADALLVHLRKDPLFEITIPSKIQAYMAVGKPMLTAVDGDAADLVLHSNGGVVVKSEDVEILANAANNLGTLAPEQLLSMGRRAKAYYQEHLALSVGVAKFGAIFLRLATKAQLK